VKVVEVMCEGRHCERSGLSAEGQRAKAEGIQLSFLVRQWIASLRSQ
jgi:hypothetical protein